MPHLVCLDKAGQYLLSLGTISHNPEKLFVMDFSGLRVWRHKPQPQKLVDGACSYPLSLSMPVVWVLLKYKLCFVIASLQLV